MNSIFSNCKHCFLLLLLLLWIPIESLAQKYEMVVEKTNGTELTFRITDDYPLLEYQYGGEAGVNTIVIQMADGWAEIPCPEIKRLFTREVILLPGDVTDSGKVDVQDATLVVNYILGKKLSEYDYTIADMNEDGELDVFDVTAIINVILSGRQPASYLTRSPMRRTDATETLEQMRLTSDKNALMLGIDDAVRFTSFQFDVEVPQGGGIMSIAWNEKADGHLLRFAQTGENRYTVVALSMNSRPLPTLSDGLLRISLSNAADGEVCFNNILFVTPNGEAVRFGGCALDMRTGIQNLTVADEEQIYDLSGREIQTSRKKLADGFYLINNKKVIIK